MNACRIEWIEKAPPFVLFVSRLAKILLMTSKERGSKASYSTDSDYSTLDASDASSAVQYVLLFGESVPYLARTLSD